MKQDISIEALLDWAYRVQCVDKACSGFMDQRPSASPSSGLASYLALGTKVDSSGYAAKIIGSENVNDDALIVHNAVLALPDYFMEFQTGSRIRLWTEASAENDSGAIEVEGKGNHAIYSLRLPGRAPRPLRQVVTSVLVYLHAKAGTAPECYLDWKPKRGAPPKGGVDAWGRRGKASDGLSLRDVAVARGEYSAWFLGLNELVKQLHGALDKFRVVDCLVLPRPWERDSVAAKACFVQ